jgi:hypothetical protein
MSMNTQLIEQSDVETQSLSVSEQARTRGAIEASLTVAAARPRNEQRAIAQVQTSCQRVRLAESAVYSYAKGGSEITGPSISLVVQVALAWGNLDWGYRELSRGRGESTVEAYAWDQQTNARYSRQFIVPHRIRVGGRQRQLREDELADWIANQAQRRVRTCLENVIPRDVIEEAVDECARTLKANIDLDATKIMQMVEKFAEIGVSQDQIVAKLQRSVDAIQPAQYLAMRRIYVAIQDGLQTVDQAFPAVEPAEPKPSQGQQLMAKAKTKPKPRPKKPAKPHETGSEPDDADNADVLTADEKVIESFQQAIKEAKTKEHLNLLADQVAYDASMGALQELHAAGLTKRIAEKIENIEEQQ